MSSSILLVCDGSLDLRHQLGRQLNYAMIVSRMGLHLLDQLLFAVGAGRKAAPWNNVIARNARCGLFVFVY
jgi:hypothetical protein